MTALAVAIALTFREDVGLRWFGPDFIAPGAKLPEAKLGEKPPSAPVVHVSKEWITVRAKRVASADEAISDPDLVVEALYEEIWSIAEELGLRNGYYERSAKVGDRIIPTYGPEDDLIIQADRTVEFELLLRILYTCGQAGYNKWHLAAINGEDGELEVITTRPLVTLYPGRDGISRIGAGLISGIGAALIAREGTTALELEYQPIPEIEAPQTDAPQYAVVLYVGDDWFLLPDSDASATIVLRNIAEDEYSVLAEKLKQIKRRYPHQKCLIIGCDAHVKYEELIHVIEVSIQPGIGLTEIYITGFKGLGN